VITNSQGSREKEISKTCDWGRELVHFGISSFYEMCVTRDEVPQKVKQQMGTQKFMLTVIRGIDGFHVADLMTEQHSYNTQYFLSHILEPLLLVVFPDGRKPHSRRLSLYLSNYHVHRSNASENFLAAIFSIRVTHPPDNPDLKPSDVWFFGHIKVGPAGQLFS
jgi:hypothetical protein